MRRIACFVVLALAAACGGDGDETRSDDAERSTDEPVTAADLEAALLTADDLPPGFTPAEIPLAPASDTEGICNGPNLAARAEENSTGYISAVFGQADTFISEDLFTFSDEDSASSVIEGTRAAAESCTTFELAGPDGTEAAEVAIVPFPDLGDEVVATRLMVTPGTVLPPVEVDVLVRVGNVVIVTGQFGVTIDEGLTERYARETLRKVLDELAARDE